MIEFSVTTTAQEYAVCSEEVYTHYQTTTYRNPPVTIQPGGGNAYRTDNLHTEAEAGYEDQYQIIVVVEVMFTLCV